MATNYYCNYNSLHILTQNNATIVTITTKWDSLSHTNSILYVGRNIVQVHLAGGSEDWSILGYNALPSNKYLLNVYRSVVPPYPGSQYFSALLGLFDSEDGGNKLLWNVINCELGWSHSLKDLNILYFSTPLWEPWLALKVFDTLNIGARKCEMPVMLPTPIQWRHPKRALHYNWTTTKASNHLGQLSVLISWHFNGSIDKLDGVWEHEKVSVFSCVILQFPW